MKTPPIRSENSPDVEVSEGPIGKLLRELKTLLRVERLRTRNEWRRTLPLGDYVSNRWEKASELGFGQGSSIYDSSLVIGDVRVGANTWIGPFTILDGSGTLEIGDFCSISAGVQIYTHDTVQWAISGGHGEIEYSAVHIGSCCYIGPGTIISKGVTIGSRCIIGANSFVNRDIPEGSRAWGTPCKIQPMVTIGDQGPTVADPQAPSQSS